MKKETASGRGKVIVGGLAAFCTIVSLAMSIPAKADVSVSSAGSPEEIVEAQQPATGTLAGHEYVDLGLSVKWATCNLGAYSPEEYGKYYAWGETTTTTDYSKSSCATWNRDISDIAGNPQYDAARANWGGSWRLPTEDEMRELVEKCTWTWTTRGGYNGYKVTGPNGNSIFLPAAGFRAESSLYVESKAGHYWCSIPYEGSDTQFGELISMALSDYSTSDESDTQNACCLHFNKDYPLVGCRFRYCGYSVRPVSE